MSMAYENEQRALKESVSALTEELEHETDKAEGLQQFIDRVKQTVRPTVLTPELVHGFIEKIVVHAPEYNDTRKRTQVVDIYYSGVGVIPNYSLEGLEQAVQNWWKKHPQETVKTA